MDQILGQIQAFAFWFDQMGWAQCYGQILNVAQNQALFSLIGNKFGGDGRTTFALPDLRGRTIIGVGQGTGLTAIAWGEKGGAEKLALSLANLPAHTHQITNGDGTGATVKVTTTLQSVNNSNETNDSGNGANYLGTTDSNMPNIYREATASDNSVKGVASTISGNTGVAGAITPAAIGLRNPYLGLMYCIAIEGLYPVRP